MKYFLLFFLYPTMNFGQVHDSLAVSQMVDSLITSAQDLASDKGEFEKSLRINAMAQTLAIDSFGKNSAEYAGACYNKGWIGIIMKDYIGAELSLIEALSLYKLLGLIESEDYARCSYNLGLVYWYTQKYDFAKKYYEESLNLFRNVYGLDHSNCIVLFINMSILYRKLGMLDEALSYCLQAKKLQEVNIGLDHPQYLGIINNLANIYNDLGLFSQAEILFIEVKDARKKMYGEEHIAYAASLNNLSGFYRAIGQYEKAVQLQIESKAIRLKLEGAESENYATSCNNLGNLYKDMGKLDDAEELFLESKRIREHVLNRDHVDYAQICNNLGNLYKTKRQFDKAELLLVESLRIYENKFGKGHFDFAMSLQNLADLYSLTNKKYEAELMYLESDSLLSGFFGVGHSHFSTSKYNLALFYMKAGDVVNAANYSLNYQNSIKLELSRTHSFLSEYEMFNYINRFEDRQNAIYSLAEYMVESNQMDETLLKLCYDNALFYKGYILNSIKTVNNKLAKDQSNMYEYQRLKAIHRQLAALYIKPMSMRQGVLDLEESANLIEKKIAREVTGYSDLLRQVNWQEVQMKLKQGEAAVEFVKYTKLDSSLQNQDSIMYAAIVIQAGNESPIFISLFEEDELDFLLHFKDERRADYVNNLYGFEDRSLKSIGHSRRSLYDILWKKMIDEVFVNVHTVYFSPTGILFRLNMNAIPLSDDQILSDRVKLIELGSTRQLVLNSWNVEDMQANTSIIFGGVNFELDTINIDSTLGQFSSDLALYSSQVKSRNVDNRTPFNFLKWTLKEGLAIKEILELTGNEVIFLDGKKATEDALNVIGLNSSLSPRVIHIATHGFFLPDPKLASNAINPLDGLQTADNPMIRSGVILAGGNYAWQSGHSFNTTMNDGIVTAYEISQMNLGNTELVVLSACETGLGDIRGSEGVYGLQRAFKIAGVRYLIMSLWQVPDYQTHELMTEFYKKWLIEKMPVRDALISAQNMLRMKHYDPYYWAGFVLIE